MQKVKPHIITVVTGIICNLLLFLVKLYIGISTNSITIYLDSINNLMDTFVCTIAVAGFWILSIKPNEKYPFGFGKSEDLVSFVSAVIIFLTSASFIYASLERVLYPVPVRFSVKYVALITATAALKLLLVVFYKYRYKKTPSPVIKGLQVDSILDSFITLSTIFSFTLTEFTGYSIDGFFGLAMGIMLMISSIKLCCTACGKLLGKKDKELYSEVLGILNNNDYISDVQKLFIHSYGQKNVISCEICVSTDNFNQINGIKENIKDTFLKKFSADIIISVIGGNNFEKN